MLGQENVGVDVEDAGGKEGVELIPPDRAIDIVFVVEREGDAIASALGLRLVVHCFPFNCSALIHGSQYLSDPAHEEVHCRLIENEGKLGQGRRMPLVIDVHPKPDARL